MMNLRTHSTTLSNPTHPVTLLTPKCLPALLHSFSSYSSAFPSSLLPLLFPAAAVTEPRTCRQASATLDLFNVANRPSRPIHSTRISLLLYLALISPKSLASSPQPALPSVRLEFREIPAVHNPYAAQTTPLTVFSSLGVPPSTSTSELRFKNRSYTVQ